MRSNRKSPQNPTGPSRVFRGSAPGNSARAAAVEGGAKDGASRKLGQLGRKLGNAELDGKIKGADKKRDGLLEFIGQRLKALQSVQAKELAEIKDIRQWFRAVARGEKGVTLPDPTRWHESARTYKLAAQALANGHLARGTQLLEKAIALEEQAFESAPDQVKEQLKGPEEAAAAPPPAMAEISSTAVCSKCALPEEIGVADRILNILDVLEDSPPLRARRRGWWEEGEEEEEEGAEKKEGAESARDGRRRRKRETANT